MKIKLVLNAKILQLYLQVDLHNIALVAQHVKIFSFIII